jgi:prepilin-type N-terminal cleavage/methylation domain-containing protein
MKKFRFAPAFTLAEVLITVAIIGIVSALTIPTLIQKNRERVLVHQLKTTYSLLGQGMRLYMAEEGVSDLTGDQDWKTDTSAFQKLFKTYFKVQRDCGHKYAPCFSRYYTSYPTKERVDMNCCTCETVVTLMNGASICADNYKNDDSRIIGFEIDINGSAPPNVFGYDFFDLDVDKNGAIFDYDYKKDGFDPAKSLRDGAVGRIMADGWKITYPMK